MARRLTHLNMLDMASILSLGSESALPTRTPGVRRGYGTQRCAGPDCKRTISLNKCWCMAHAPAEDVDPATAPATADETSAEAKTE
jgi:hypothetical protein